MWVAVHALSGLSLGAFAPLRMILTVVAALGLHLVLDLIPHWDYTRQRSRLAWSVADVAISAVLVIALTLFLHLPARALVAGVVSAAPDLDVFDAVLPGRARRRLFPSHWRGFPHGEAQPLVGVCVQVVVALAAIAGVLMKSI